MTITGIIQVLDSILNGIDDETDMQLDLAREMDNATLRERKRVFRAKGRAQYAIAELDKVKIPIIADDVDNFRQTVSRMNDVRLSDCEEQGRATRFISTPGAMEKLERLDEELENLKSASNASVDLEFSAGTLDMYAVVAGVSLDNERVRAHDVEYINQLKADIQAMLNKVDDLVAHLNQITKAAQRQLIVLEDLKDLLRDATAYANDVREEMGNNWADYAPLQKLEIVRGVEAAYLIFRMYQPLFHRNGELDSGTLHLMTDAEELVADLR
jgi:hypothetical protein